jgi:hypothetical protein
VSRLLHDRGMALAILLCGLVLLGTAASLEPDPRGFGTHEQLGLPPCGFEDRTGIPCPTCGVTTSFAHFARGQVLEAFRVHAGAAAGFVLLAGVTLLAALRLAVAWPDLSRWRRAGVRVVLPAILLVWLGHWGTAVVRVVAFGAPSP